MRFLPICATIIVVLYVGALHPLSGHLGGLFFLLTGWAIPTIFNFLLSAWCASFIKATIWIRLICFALFSLLLGINTSLQGALARLGDAPNITTEIARAVSINSTTKIELQDDRNRSLLVTADPLSSPFDAGGDEGCGCMYFYFNHSANYYLVAENLILQYTGLRAIGFMGLKPNEGVRFRLRLTQDEKAHETANLSVEIYEGHEKMASFVQRGIRYDPDVNERIGRDRGLDNGHFFENCFSMLLHDNIWTHLLREYVSYVPRTALRDFLAKATPRA